MSTLSVPATQSLLLDGVDWKTYTRLLRALDERPGVRLTYDRGSLEIMTLTHEHESYAHLLGRFVVVLTEGVRVAHQRRWLHDLSAAQAASGPRSG